MDKNSIIGMLLIGAIFIGYNYYTAPTDEQIAEARAKYVQDSTQYAEEQKLQEKAALEAATAEPVVAPVLSDSAQAAQDSIMIAKQSTEFGVLAPSSVANDDHITVETDKLILQFASKGGRLVSAEVKDFVTWDKRPLILFQEDSSNFDLRFNLDGKTYHTTDLYSTLPTSTVISGDNSQELRLRFNTVDPDKYLEQIYVIKGNDYMIDYRVESHGLDNFAGVEKGSLALDWSLFAQRKEKSAKQERLKTTVFFQYVNEGKVDYVSEGADGDEMFEENVSWVALKQQYFTATLVNEGGFLRNDSACVFTATTEGETDRFTKELKAQLWIPLVSATSTSQMHMYLGPNDQDILLPYEQGLEGQIDWGWGIFGWINEHFVIHFYNLLSGWGLSAGMVILILTICIKLMLSPITYKNYVSSAKMRVLKPDIEVLTEKHGDDAMKKQQATMELYRKAGVNPMAGCIPMLLQMPILYAMFRFFPSMIDLRQKSFLWAEDLASYDAIFTWTTEIPLISWAYGQHFSLFTFLMAISMFFYTKVTNSQMAMSGPQATQMKMMMYFMPVMMLCFFNDYASGLSYYYLTANVITIIQTFVIKKYVIDEGAIREKIEANKKRPGTAKKGKFAQKLEEMQKLQEQRQGKKK